MRREEISEAVSNLDPKFVLEAATYSWKKRRITKLFRGGAAVAAMVCLAVLLHTLIPQQPAGIFTVKAYALDLDDSGAVVLREEDLLEKSDYWGGYCDGENYYVNMGFRYEGENIQQVTFTTEEGFFAQQQITPGMSQENISAIYAGPENDLIVFGEEFTVCGSSVTLEGGEMEEGLLLFWGIQALSADDIPKNPQITAEAVFQDGSTQTVDVSLDLSGMGVFGGKSQKDPQDGRPVAYHQSQYYKNLPLEDCELVNQQTVTDVYEYTVGDYLLSIQVPERDSFDENGLYRVRRQRISGAFYLLVFQLEGDECVARLYKVPQELEYSPENEEKLTRQQAEQDGASVGESAAPAADTPSAVNGEAQSAGTAAVQTGPSAGETSDEQDASPQNSGSEGLSVRTGMVSEAERLKRLSRFDYYCGLPPSELELIHEEAVTDLFIYRIDIVENRIPVSENLPFDEDGYYVCGVYPHDEGTLVSIIYRDPQGGLWGQLYRVPEELVYPE